MSDVVVRCVGISKQYRIGARAESYRTARDTIAAALAAPFRRRDRERDADRAGRLHWALKGVSFDVERGEVVGVIGRNGAGKSTLLKVLSRITDPTSGYADVVGRVGSLLEVGSGFHAELTGRENAYLSGAILGMKRAEIASKFDEIVAFAGVERFIDTPVKHYSTGMHLRLAFAVAAHLEPEVLMVDEVLAVGDAAFQRKCLGKMQEVGQSGRTVLFVSHDLTAVMQLAPRSILLEDGSVRFDGPSHEAIRLYSAQQGAAVDLDERHDRKGDGLVRVRSLRCHDKDGRLTSSVASGEPITLVLTCQSRVHDLEAEDLSLQVRINDLLGRPILTLSTRFSPVVHNGRLTGHDTFSCHVPRLDLAEDTYSLDVWIDYRGAQSDLVTRAAELTVTASDRYGTGVAPTARWHGATIVEHRWDLEAGAGAGTPEALAAGATVVERGGS